MQLKTNGRFYRWFVLSLIGVVAVLAQSSVIFADDPMDMLVIDLASSRGEPTDTVGEITPDAFW